MTRDESTVLFKSPPRDPDLRDAGGGFVGLVRHCGADRRVVHRALKGH